MPFDAWLHKIAECVSATLGLQIRSQDHPAFVALIEERRLALKVSPEQYYGLLQQQLFWPRWGPEGELQSEWNVLATRLTVCESYFFRDRQQIALLQQRILPSLIAQKRGQAGNCKPALRLWSAGCAGGEEAYSLAILLRELLPDWANWDVQIIGTDINPECIQRAQRGAYRQWSFRQVEPERQRGYFDLVPPEWIVRPSIRQWVQFGVENLLGDRPLRPVLDLHNFDLIVCRNVFIYFQPTAIAQVLQRFHEALVPGGYLLTGHTELHGQNLRLFQSFDFPESSIHQRPLVSPGASPNGLSPERESRALPPRPAPTATALTVAGSTALARPTAFTRPAALARPAEAAPAVGSRPDPEPDPVPEWLQAARLLLVQGDYAQVIADLQHQAAQTYAFERLMLLAHAYANQGSYEAARSLCQEGAQLRPLATEPLALLAHIADDMGDRETAKRHWQRVIYLEPERAWAYLNLAELYAQEQNTSRAETLRRSAFRLLEQLPPDTYVDPQQQITVADLRAQFQ